MIGQEVWKPVPSVQYLEASSWGRVRSRPYHQAMPNGGIRQRQLLPTYGIENQTSDNYSKLHIVFRRKTYTVSRLVCEAFNGPPPDTASKALHEDDDPSNNTPGNLNWGTQRQNLNTPRFLDYCRARKRKVQPVATA